MKTTNTPEKKPTDDLLSKNNFLIPTISLSSTLLFVIFRFEYVCFEFIESQEACRAPSVFDFITCRVDGLP